MAIQVKELDVPDNDKKLHKNGETNGVMEKGEKESKEGKEKEEKDEVVPVGLGELVIIFYTPCGHFISTDGFYLISLITP